MYTSSLVSLTGILPRPDLITRSAAPQGANTNYDPIQLIVGLEGVPFPTISSNLDMHLTGLRGKKEKIQPQGFRQSPLSY